MEKRYEFEYYDRERKIIRIGTFIKINDNVIEKGQEFICPPCDIYGEPLKKFQENAKFAGCCEGRSDPYPTGLPIVLSFVYRNGYHLKAKKYGAFASDLCYMEIE